MNAGRLARALRALADSVTEIEGGIVPTDRVPTREEVAKCRQLRDSAELTRVLARVLEGKSLDAAFGAPGDWGYGTSLGDALAGAPETQRSTQPQGSDKTEGEGGVSRTEPALTALAELVALKDLKDEFYAAELEMQTIEQARANRRKREDYNTRKPLAWEAARALIATKSHPSGDQGL